MNIDHYCLMKKQDRTGQQKSLSGKIFNLEKIFFSRNKKHYVKQSYWGYGNHLSGEYVQEKTKNDKIEEELLLKTIFALW